MLLMPVLTVQALSSCMHYDEPTGNPDEPATVNLAFSVSQSVNRQTRMADVVVQEQEGERRYRGLGDVYMIPFTISGEVVQSTDHMSRLMDDPSLITPSYPKGTGDYGGFYLYNIYTLVRGINAFLVYAKASTVGMAPPAGVTDKVYYGSLQVPDLIYPDLETLRFSPDPIYNYTTAPEEASLMAGFLNYIAAASITGHTWGNTEDSTLKLLFKLFTGQENDGSMVMAGATENVIAHINTFYELISQLNYEPGTEGHNLQTAIISRIQEGSYTNDGKTLTMTNNGETGNNWRLTGMKIGDTEVKYPASKSLPDGAAAMIWNTTTGQFEPQTVTTTLANVNGINRFCYPPELFYRTNSRINTSNDEDFQSSYSSETDWAEVLAKYENNNAMVTGNTKGVAIRNPLHYAVGRLKMSLQEVATSTLKDDAGKDIPLTHATTHATKPSFPLTGVIICNQHPVDFNFKPVLVNGQPSHADDHFIYDSQVGTSCCLRQKTGDEAQSIPIPSTLVLQSYNDEEVTIALEFLNDSGTDFRGKGGVVYNGTKFYLMGKINPSENTTTSTPDAAAGRVFTQDYITTVSTKVETLANAYNVLPNILGGRLELGVQLTPKWIQAKTTNVILE